MTTNTFAIDPQLLADSHPLFCWQQSHLRLHKNASVPWLIVIPETNHTEFHDLPADMQLNITRISQVCGDYFKCELGAEKINFAAIGNVVQQLHIHVVGRHSKDLLWPEVVWGNVLFEKFYSNQEVAHIHSQLLKRLEL